MEFLRLASQSIASVTFLAVLVLIATSANAQVDAFATGPGAPALKWGSTDLYTEDGSGNPIYDYRIVDLIFDTYLKNGVRPYVQLGFMPQAMSPSVRFRHGRGTSKAHSKTRSRNQHRTYNCSFDQSAQSNSAC